MKSSSTSIKRLLMFVLVGFVLSILVVSVASAKNEAKEKTASSESANSSTANQAANNDDEITPQAQQAAALDLVTASNGTANIATNSATGVVRFASFPQGLNDFTVNDKSKLVVDKQINAFFDSYGAAFGIKDASTQLSYVNNITDDYGYTHVNYVQIQDEVEIYASTMRIHYNDVGQLTAVNGTIIPNIKVSPQPQLTPTEAAAIAVAAVDSSTVQPTGSKLSVISNKLYYYHTGLIQSIPGTTLLAYEIEVSNQENVREFVFVDAHSGSIIDQFTGIYEGIGARRQVSESTLANVVWDYSTGDPDPIPNGWNSGSTAQVNAWQDEIDGADETYNTIDNLTNGNYSSYNGSEAVMRTVNNDPNISCPNANWNGVSTNYCNGTSSDDIVSHEWGHAYTEYTNGMVYAWQPGALNESYSDIWGEVVDLINGRGTDNPGGLRTVGSCSSFGSGGPPNESSRRWLMGEDSSAFGGAIRDMWNPTCYGDPGKVSDTQYYCASTDNGGVHRNSGIPNHAFALLVDGGTYNGQAITGIGLDKAANIYWRAQSIYQSASTDFPDHASAIAQSCTDLIGQSINALNSNFGVINPASSITVGDCAQLNNVITAVELNTPPTQCGFDPAFINAPPLCSGQGSGVVNSIYTQTWESGSTGWITGTHDIANPPTFTNPDWVIRGNLPGSRTGNAMYVEDSINRGACTPADTVAGALNLDSPVFTVPAGTPITRVAVDHFVATESGWDGGNVKISVNGGSWTILPASVFEVNGYFPPAVLNNVGAGNDNPLAGEAAFTGGGEGSVSSGWGQSQLNLTGYVNPGDSFQLRFDMGLDGCNGVDGWYIDNFEVYSCVGEATSVNPDIFISPDNMANFQPTNTQSSQTLSIGNIGSTDLVWSIEEEPALPVAPFSYLAPALPAEMGSRPGTSEDTTPPLNYIPQADFSEGFEDITNLPGWAMQNNPDTSGTTEWFQGNDTVFAAHSGAATSYIGANYNNTGGSQISNWLITPESNFTSSSQISFWTRTATGSQYPDRLQIRVSTNGNSINVGSDPSDVGDFTNLELDINATLSVGGYPDTWTQFNVDLSPYAGQSGRVAFRYFVPTDAGPTGANSNYIGIDTVEFIEISPCALPSDVSWLSVTPTGPVTTSFGSTESVNVMFDSTSISAGSYNANLCINSNDPVNPLVIVPVSMTVVEDIFVDDDFDNTTPGWGVTYFDSIQNGIDAALMNANVFVAEGTYNETASVNKNVKAQIQGAISLSGNLDLQQGTFNAPAGNINIGGNFLRQAGNIFNANGGTITFNGSTQQNLTLNSATSFNNLVVGSGTTLVEITSVDNATMAGTLTNNGTIRKSQSVNGPATYTFGLIGGTVVVNDDGSGSLTSIQIDSIDQNQPDATTANVQTGRYWDINANSGATNFNVDLTLPVTFVPAEDGSDKLCRYTGDLGDPYPFECGLQTENSGNAGALTLTRQNVTQFSSWTAGINTSPTAVTLKSFSSSTIPTGLVILCSLMLISAIISLLTWRRKR